MTLNIDSYNCQEIEKDALQTIDGGFLPAVVAFLEGVAIGVTIVSGLYGAYKAGH